MAKAVEKTEITLIKSGGEITTAWLSTVLRSHGAIDFDQEVAVATVEAFGEAGGLMGSLYRAKLGYEGATSGPPSVIIKLPMDDPAQRGVADMLQFFNRECTFYAEVAESAPYNTALVYGIARATDGSSDFVIVMEDLGHLNQIDQVAGATVEQMDSVVTAIAKQHAQHWESDGLDELAKTFMPINSELYLTALPAVFAGSWEQTKEHGAHLLTEDLIAFGDNFGAHLPHLLQTLSSRPTLVHGDFRGDNLMMNDAGELTIIDFQISGIGSGIYDIGYFMSQSVESDLRRANDDRVVQLYCDTLRAEGIEVDDEATRSAYRVGFAFFLIYATTSFQAWDAFDGRQHDLMMKMLSRALTAVLDNDSLGLLPSID